MPYFLVEKTITADSELFSTNTSDFGPDPLPEHVRYAQTLVECGFRDCDRSQLFQADINGHTYNGVMCQDRALAFSAMEDPKTQHVLFLISQDEQRNWTQREQDRLTSGEYIPVPWADEVRYTTSVRNHYAHLSLKHPGLVAYTENVEKGLLDRQTVVRPGKYLETYLSTLFSKTQIANYIADCESDLNKLSFAVTPDEIIAVYLNGPRSCMSHPVSEYETNEHPVSVYGNSDLQVAYLGDVAKRVSGRCVVWPEKKIYSRIYGHEIVMQRLLADLGYSSGSLSGARVRRVVDDRGHLVMPYVDYISGATLKNGWVVLGRGDISTDSTTGIGEAAEDEEIEMPTCSHCGDSFDGDPNEDSLCPDCEDNRTSCLECQDEIFTDSPRHVFETENGYVCRTCHADTLTTCSVCETEFYTCDFSGPERRTRSRNGLETLCAECEDSHVCCADCGQIYHVDLDRCNACEQPPATPRCTETRDLLAPVAAFAEWRNGDPIIDGFSYTLVHTETDSNLLIRCNMLHRLGSEPATSIGSADMARVIEARDQLVTLYPDLRYFILQTPEPITVERFESPFVVHESMESVSCGA